MKENTKTTTIETQVAETATVNQYIMQDLRASLLIVSLVLNLAIFTFWLALQVTSVYDDAVVGMLFNR